MNRRDFVRSVAAGAAALLLPTWGETQRKRPINLQAFCRNDDSRYGNMQEPFVQHSLTEGPYPLLHRYGTDGHVAVRVACGETDKGDEKAKRPPVAGLCWEREKGIWLPWPKEHYEVKDDAWCADCDGRGYRNPKECPKCGGYGHEMAGSDWMAYEQQCKACKGSGGYGDRCDTCHGKGRGRLPHHQLMPNGLLVCTKYDRLVRAELPGLEFSPVLTPPIWNGRSDGLKESLGPIRIRFEGGEGLLMPLSRNIR